MLKDSTKSQLKNLIPNVLQVFQPNEPRLTDQAIQSATEAFLRFLDGYSAEIEEKVRPERLKNATEVAKDLCVSNKFIWTLVKRGCLTPIRLGRRVTRFSSIDVERCMQGFSDISKRETPKSPGRPRKNPVADAEAVLEQTAENIPAANEKEVC